MSTDACITAATMDALRDNAEHNHAFLMVCFILCWVFVAIFACANSRRERALTKVLAAVEASATACRCDCPLCASNEEEEEEEVAENREDDL